MSSGLAAVVVASGVQGGGAHPPPAHGTALLMAGLAAVALAGVAVAWWLRRRRRPRRVEDQWGALAVMGELCPHGWQAQVTIYGWGAPVPEDAPPARTPQVALEWTQYDEEPGRVVVARRVWAPTISRALELMVEDRRTDVELEAIEHDARARGLEDW